ncbi:DsbE family thiol:disulfide interchange protein [Siccirubricoccus sp. KC 17139]|uniref:DsbE family thiol:disulfide interchange protein n=1 Tax=Siccirubricoccus soli TaxID=2899147 RepID=A0ABT1D8F5_9PROT|nr:DsbE family thiol:disulfide interchange protein [Siccirubricoccus soli]MCO6418208.1 DsbE family thiol:disulfide interchange protein [Siccirubricoccus soli]MCP2684343.1 DsbE family thiol:disulfide interchange protein [Siccirubricoccus soli]
MSGAGASPPPDGGAWPAKAAPRGRSRRSLLLLAPLGVAAAAGAGFYAMLRGLGTGSYNPRGVPSALIGKAPPDFALPPLEGAERPGVSAADLRAHNGPLGRPVLVNFFASWCVPCVIEHPQLMRLAREGVPLLGIAYKDKPEDSLGFLRRHGNPFAKLGVDQPGRVAIDWGLYGVPETYLIDKEGIIRWRWAGPITNDTLGAELQPLLRRYA